MVARAPGGTARPSSSRESGSGGPSSFHPSPMGGLIINGGLSSIDRAWVRTEEQPGLTARVIKSQPICVQNPVEKMTWKVVGIGLMVSVQLLSQSSCPSRGLWEEPELF